MNHYDYSLNRQGINGERLGERLIDISRIGRTEYGGSNRPGYSALEKAAKEIVQLWMEALGFTTYFDEADNLIGRLAGQDNHLPAIVCGSHIDTVPNGGHFDGVLGILSALEVAEAWQTTERQLKHPLEIIVFSDEEGTRFNTGFTGSKAMMGEVLSQGVKHLKDDDGVTFEQALDNLDLSLEDFSRAKRRSEEFAAYIELHIEQGRQLEMQDQPVGIVSGIAGQFGMNVTVEGRAEHAGNTPMNNRQDALLATSDFIVRANHIPVSVSETAVLTVGKLHVQPNGTNVIPGQVAFTIDCRDIIAENLNLMKNEIEETLLKIEKKYNVNIEWQETFMDPPGKISDTLKALQSKVLKQAGFPPLEIPSGAGHDAMTMAKDVPTAMFFARSKDGLSHNPKEWTSLDDCVKATHVLKLFLEKIDEKI